MKFQKKNAPARKKNIFPCAGSREEPRGSVSLQSHPVLPPPHLVQSNLPWLDWCFFPPLPLVLVHHHGPLPPHQLLCLLQDVQTSLAQLLVDLLHGGVDAVPLPV